MSEERGQEDSQVWLDERIDLDEHVATDVALQERSVSEGDSGETPATKDAFGPDAVQSEGLMTVDRVSGLITSLESANIAPAKASVLKSILKNIRSSIDNAITLLDGKHGETPELKTEISASTSDAVSASEDRPRREREALEGVFSGSSMVGEDGREYTVPPNYASKSKLVEGDMLKLYIGERGNFIFKQIGPIERQRLIGNVSFEQENGQYTVLAAGRSWKVLKASVTYFKAEVGDEAIILVPKNAPSKWAAVENIISRTSGASHESST